MIQRLKGQKYSSERKEGSHGNELLLLKWILLKQSVCEHWSVKVIQLPRQIFKNLPSVSPPARALKAGLFYSDHIRAVLVTQKWIE